MGEADYRVNLHDGFSGPAGQIVNANQQLRGSAAQTTSGLRDQAGALTSLRGKIERSAEKLRDFGVQLTRARTDLMLLERAGSGATPKQVSAAKAKVESLTGSIEKQRGKLKSLQDAYHALGETMRATWSTAVRGVRQNMTASERWMASMKRHRSQMGAMGRGAIGVTAPTVQPGGEGTLGMFRAAGIIAALGTVVMLAKRAAEAVGRIAIAFGAAVVKAAAFGGAMKFSLTKFLGSEQAATEEMGNLVAMSNRLGVSLRDIAPQFKSLVSAGFDVGWARELVAWKADLSAFANTERDVERLNEAFVQLEKGMAAGRLEADGFYSILQNLPKVTKKGVMQELAKSMDVDIAKLMKMDITKLPVDQVIKAMQTAFLRETGAGKFGEAAIEKQFSTLEGAWNAFKSMIDNSLIDIGAKFGPILKEDLLPLFKQARDWLGGEEGKAAIQDVVTGLKSAWKIGKEFVKGLGEGFKGTLPALKSLAKWLIGMGDNEQAVSGFRMLGVALGKIAGFAVEVIGAFVMLGAITSQVAGWFGVAWDAIAEWASGLWESITGLAGQALTAASSIGTGIIDGLIAGIKAGLSGVVSAITGVIQSGIAAGKKMLDMGSPSKVFAEMGKMSAAGYEQGMSEGARGIREATQRAVAPPTSGGFGGTTNNYGGPVTISAPVNVDGAAEPEAVAREIGRQLRGKLGPELAKLTLQYAAG